MERHDGLENATEQRFQAFSMKENVRAQEKPLHGVTPQAVLRRN